MFFLFSVAYITFRFDGGSTSRWLTLGWHIKAYRRIKLLLKRNKINKVDHKNLYFLRKTTMFDLTLKTSFLFTCYTEGKVCMSYHSNVPQQPWSALGGNPEDAWIGLNRVLWYRPQVLPFLIMSYTVAFLSHKLRTGSGKYRDLV